MTTHAATIEQTAAGWRLVVDGEPSGEFATGGEAFRAVTEIAGRSPSVYVVEWDTRDRVGQLVARAHGAV